MQLTFAEQRIALVQSSPITYTENVRPLALLSNKCPHQNPIFSRFLYSEQDNQ